MHTRTHARILAVYTVKQQLTGLGKMLGCMPTAGPANQ